ncbi:MAG: FtsB family cell division protein [Egibacteraceae bacterium]
MTGGRVIGCVEAGRDRAQTLTMRTFGWLGQGDRIYLLATLCLALLLFAMAFGPAQSYAAAGDRVAQLFDRRAHLQSEVDRLEERRLSLQDEEEIELLAREQFGFVRPGEIPYVVVGPGNPVDKLEIAVPEPEAAPWYRRLIMTLQQLIGS